LSYAPFREDLRVGLAPIEARPNKPQRLRPAAF